VPGAENSAIFEKKRGRGKQQPRLHFFEIVAWFYVCEAKCREEVP
jgi:hypothetical protein